MRVLSILIEALEPGVTGAMVMASTHTPLLANDEIVLVASKHPFGRHHPASEEVPRHPVAGIPVLVSVRVGPMTKDVREGQSAGREPTRNSLEKRPMVAHVLHHLDRNEPIELFVRLEIVDVRRLNAEVGKRPLRSTAFDERTLNPGV